MQNRFNKSVTFPDNTFIGDFLFYTHAFMHKLFTSLFKLYLEILYFGELHVRLKYLEIATFYFPQKFLEDRKNYYNKKQNYLSRYGILTVEPSSSFSRRFCSTGQNGMFSVSDNLLFVIIIFPSPKTLLSEEWRKQK